MKKTLFLATLLGATLGFSNTSFAGSVPEPFDPSIYEDFNITLGAGDTLDIDDPIGQLYNRLYDSDWGRWVRLGDRILVNGGRAVPEADMRAFIKNGAVSGLVVIAPGAELVMKSDAPYAECGDLLQSGGSSSFNEDNDFPGGG